MSKIDKIGAQVAPEVAKLVEAAMQKRQARPLFEVQQLAKALDEIELVPRLPLVGDFLYQREIGLCVGQTGVGKSVLFMQVLNQVAKGETPGQHYGLECKAPPQKVLYLDFENDVEEWKARLGSLNLSPNLYRADFSTEAEGAPSAEDIVQAIVDLIKPGAPLDGCTVVGIDNITYLFDGSQRDMHEESIQLFKLLNRVRKEYGVAILIAAHRNKNDVHALELGSVSGSSKNIQFVQSVFGIASATGDDDSSGRVYLKQLKVRGRQAKWTSGNVLTGRLTTYDGALQVVTDRECYNERALLDGTGKSIRAAVLELLVQDPERSGSSLADELGGTRQNVNKLISTHDLRNEARRMRSDNGQTSAF